MPYRQCFTSIAKNKIGENIIAGDNETSADESDTEKIIQEIFVPTPVLKEKNERKNKKIIV